MCTRIGFTLCATLLLVVPALAGEPTAADRTKALIVRIESHDARIRYEALAEAATNPDEALAGALIKALKDEYPENRKRAAQALAKCPSKSKKKAATALARRVPTLSGKEDKSEELRVVVKAIGELGQKTSVKPLLKGLSPKTSREEAEARLRAVAEIPHADAIEGLMQYGSKGRRGNTHANLVVGALRHATGQKFGKDPDSWRAWWRENKATFDFEAVKRKREDDAARRQEKADRKKERRKRKDAKRRKGKKDPEGEETS